MRLPQIVLASTAALVLSSSLGACSLSVDRSGAGSSRAAQVEQNEPNKTTSAGSQGSANADAQGPADSAGSAKTGSQAASKGSVDKDDDKDGDQDGDDAPITDATWKDIVNTGQRTEVSGTHTVQSFGSTLNLVGDLDTLTIQGSDARVAAENVDTLTIQGGGVTVYARDIDHLNIMGSDVTVHWLGDDPTIQDLGVNNTTGRLTQ